MDGMIKILPMIFPARRIGLYALEECDDGDGRAIAGFILVHAGLLAIQTGTAWHITIRNPWPWVHQSYYTPSASSISYVPGGRPSPESFSACVVLFMYRHPVPFRARTLG